LIVWSIIYNWVIYNLFNNLDHIQTNKKYNLTIPTAQFFPLSILPRNLTCTPLSWNMFPCTIDQQKIVYNVKPSPVSLSCLCVSFLSLSFFFWRAAQWFVIQDMLKQYKEKYKITLNSNASTYLRVISTDIVILVLFTFL
jgi:hypothetical protein